MSKFLEEIKAITLQANIASAQKRVDATITQCKIIIRQQAALGNFKAEIPLYNTQANKYDAEVVVAYFLNEKFKSSVAQVEEYEDSPIGRRTVDCICISWE